MRIDQFVSASGTLIPEEMMARLRSQVQKAWDESKHPRKPDGEFGNGGSDQGAPAKPDPGETERVTGPASFSTPEANALVRKWTTAGGSTQLDSDEMRAMTHLVEDEGQATSQDIHRGVAIEGLPQEVMSKYEVGDLINLPASAFTTDKGTAQIYAESANAGNSTEVIFTAKGGTGVKCIDPTAFASENGFYEQERITAGLFEVQQARVNKDGTVGIQLGVPEL